MINVGEYIRTKQGYIAKVMSVDTYVELDTLINFKKISGNHYAGQRLFDEDDLEITKHSKNIIDLIEDGDYVNGYLIVDKWYDYANKCYHLVTEGNRHIFEEDIKTILTHEMYRQNCYKIGE